MAALHARDEDSFERLTGYLHNAWFDVRSISRENDVVSIPVALRGDQEKKRLLPRFERPPSSHESELTIRHVRDMQIDESEEIAAYGTNYFMFDRSRLTIVAAPNCTVTFEVDALDIEAELRMRPYAWEASGATGIVVPIVEAEPAIGELRRAHTPSGGYAHNTLIAPFHHGSQLSDRDSDVIGDALAPFERFEVTLSTFGCFEQIGCLYLEPQPREMFIAMTEVLLAVYPEIDYPPEGLEIVPHVTIGGDLNEAQQDEIRQQVAPHLPIRGRADRVVLVERGDDGRWFDRERFELS